MIHFSDFERVVRLTPADDGKLEHRRALVSGYADGCSFGQSAEGADAADSDPGKLLAGRFSLSFVAFKEAGHEKLFSERGQLCSTGFAVTDEVVVVIEVD